MSGVSGPVCSAPPPVRLFTSHEPATEYRRPAISTEGSFSSPIGPVVLNMTAGGCRQRGLFRQARRAQACKHGPMASMHAHAAHHSGAAHRPCDGVDRRGVQHAVLHTFRLDAVVPLHPVQPVEVGDHRPVVICSGAATCPLRVPVTRRRLCFVNVGVHRLGWCEQWVAPCAVAIGWNGRVPPRCPLCRGGRGGRGRRRRLRSTILDSRDTTGCDVVTGHPSPGRRGRDLTVEPWWLHVCAAIIERELHAAFGRRAVCLTRSQCADIRDRAGWCGWTPSWRNLVGVPVWDDRVRW
jgi:hypothetical protein